LSDYLRHPWRGREGLELLTLRSEVFEIYNQGKLEINKDNIINYIIYFNPSEFPQLSSLFVKECDKIVTCIYPPPGGYKTSPRCLIYSSVHPLKERGGGRHALGEN